MTLVHKKTSTESPQSQIDKIAVKKENGDLTEEAFESKKETKPHICSICDYSCERKDQLKVHINANHGGKKPHTVKSRAVARLG